MGQPLPRGNAGRQGTCGPGLCREGTTRRVGDVTSVGKGRGDEGRSKAIASPHVPTPLKGVRRTHKGGRPRAIAGLSHAEEGKGGAISRGVRPGFRSVGDSPISQVISVSISGMLGGALVVALLRGRASAPGSWPRQLWLWGGVWYLFRGRSPLPGVCMEVGSLGGVVAQRAPELGRAGQLALPRRTGSKGGRRSDGGEVAAQHGSKASCISCAAIAAGGHSGRGRRGAQGQQVRVCLRFTSP